MNNTKKHVLKDTITKFGFGLKILKLYFHIFKYKTDSIYSLDKVIKNETKIYYNTLNAKASGNYFW